MQPVIYDLKEVQKFYSSGSKTTSERKQIIKEAYWELRPAYLRILYVGLMALSIFTASWSLSLVLNGVVAPLLGGKVSLSLVEFLGGSFLGVIAYDFYNFSLIADTARRVFREALRNKPPTDQMVLHWNRTIEMIEKNYEQLYIVDSVLDWIYPRLVNH